jgi:hypothetical protein
MSSRLLTLAMSLTIATSLECAHNAGQPTLLPWDAARADSLARLESGDQQGRDALAKAVATRDTAVIFASMRADSARTRWLRAEIAERGWPLRAVVGDTAARAAWLILQHSPDTAWQASMLPTLEQLGRRGEIPLPDVALLTDRVRVHRGQRQLYGSQFDIVNGRLVPAPIADIPNLDARRASVGLGPIAEYVKVLGEQTGLPVVWPPSR